MIKQIKQRLNNMKTVARLISISERYANDMGETEAGAEHLVLAAFDLPDGTARKAFQKAGANPDDYKEAIEKQYQDALNAVGIHVPSDEIVEPVRKNTLPEGKPSFRNVLRDMMPNTKFWSAKPLIGATVLVAVSRQESGVAVRALRVLGIDPQKLETVAEQHLP